MESMKDCLRKEGTRMCPGKASVMRSLEDMNCISWTEVLLARMWRQRNQMKKGASQALWQAVCIGEAPRFFFTTGLGFTIGGGAGDLPGMASAESGAPGANT